MNVKLEIVKEYDIEAIYRTIKNWQDLFSANVKKGDVVVIKPNWISASHKYNQNEWISVITHPSVITAVLMMVIESLNGKGKVIIADAPQTDSSWKDIMSHMEPELWTDMGKKAGIDVQVLDLRTDEWITRGGAIVARKKLPGDPLGSTVCDLKGFSEFAGNSISSVGYYGADYDVSETNEAHSNGHHMYKVSRTVLASDVLINLPKMKTHKKAGITCALKNLVGINTYKNWLPHCVMGSPDIRGDQFPIPSVKNTIESALLRKFKSISSKHTKFGELSRPLWKVGRVLFGDTRKTIRSGNWYGNDTIWRMVLDLNKILFYANSDGVLRGASLGERKKYIAIVDGIIAGDGNGPECPDQKPAGFLVAGDNPVAVDAVCAKIMGFDWQSIPSIKHAFEIQKYLICNFDYRDITVASSVSRFNKKLLEISNTEVNPFNPAFGWKGHIELK